MHNQQNESAEKTIESQKQAVKNYQRQQQRAQRS
jgi:hypothetical protein|tara:strand:- start:703 stop:804 length:102 start_codon:yes stop_codon:yes gene_type:complete